MAANRIMISLTDDDKLFLRKQKCEGLSMSFVIRKALQKYREASTHA